MTHLSFHKHQSHFRRAVISNKTNLIIAYQRTFSLIVKNRVNLFILRQIVADSFQLLSAYPEGVKLIVLIRILLFALQWTVAVGFAINLLRFQL